MALPLQGTLDAQAGLAAPGPRGGSSWCRHGSAAVAAGHLDATGLQARVTLGSVGGGAGRAAGRRLPDVVPEDGFGTLAKVAVGLDSQVRWSSGQTRATARPTMWRSSTEPRLPSFSGPSWERESAELERWSPMTQTRPGGTVMSKSWSLAASPGLRYGSLIAVPFTVIRPPSSQQTTWSPGRPMTRLMRWFSALSGSRPTNVMASRMADTTVPCGTAGVASSHWPGSPNTTMSPRLRSTGPGVSLLTMTRSLRTRVSSMDPDGM